MVRFDRAADRNNRPAFGLKKNELRKMVENLNPCFSPRLAKTARGIPHSSKRIPAMIQKEATQKWTLNAFLPSNGIFRISPIRLLRICRVFWQMP